MTEPLEDLLRRAIKAGVTTINLDAASGGAVRVGAWKSISAARGNYSTAYHVDPAAALVDAIHKALAPKPSTNLTSLLD